MATQFTLDIKEPTEINQSFNIPEPVEQPSSTIVPVANISRPIQTTPSFSPTPKQPNIQSTLSAVSARLQQLKSEQTRTRPQENFAQRAIDAASQDFSETFAGIREEAGLSDKEARARDLGNRIIERDNDYRDQIEALEENPEGKLRGALNADINDLQRNRSRELADLSFAHNVALGDYRAAEEVVNQRIADIKADQERQIRVFEMAYQFAQNDMSESEKLEAQQRFQSQMNKRNFEQQKEIAEFQRALTAPERELDRQLKLAQIGKINADAAAKAGGLGISPITGKAFTEAQNNAGTFASRIASAEEELAGGRGRFVPFLPNFAKSQDRRQFEQAEENFITAVLRRESGAAISAEEFESARGVYIPLATDGPEQLAQKAEARRTVLQGMINASAGAFEQLEGTLGLTQTDSYLDAVDAALSNSTSPYSIYLD